MTHKKQHFHLNAIVGRFVLSESAVQHTIMTQGEVCLQEVMMCVTHKSLKDAKIFRNVCHALNIII